MTTKDPGGWRQRWVATTFAMLAITEESAGFNPITSNPAS